MTELEKIKELTAKAEHEVMEKRILGGFDVYNLKKGNYVIFSMEDYGQLLNSLKTGEAL